MPLKPIFLLYISSIIIEMNTFPGILKEHIFWWKRKSYSYVMKVRNWGGFQRGDYV